MPPEAFFFFCTLIAALIAETVLSARWNPSYFRSGLVIYTKRITLYGPQFAFPAPSDLEIALRSSWQPNFLFRQLSPTELAFREKLFEFRLFSYTPIMHGHIALRQFEHVMIVRGRLNWSTLLFVFLFAVGPSREVWFVFIPFLAGVLAFIYAIQVSRYRHVVTVLREAQAARA